jgi:hypothetical protein
MTLNDLIADFRREADDRVSPFLFSREDLIVYANQGEREAAARALLLLDSSDSQVCTYNVLAGTPFIDLDRLVLRVNRAYLQTAKARLSVIGARKLDMQKPAWESDTGTPSIVVPDVETGKLRLTPIPVADDTLSISAFRLPLSDMVDNEDEPEIHDELHPYIVSWMLYRAYIKPDVDTFNPQAADAHLKVFEAQFGPPTSGSERARRDTSRARYEESK